MTTEPTVQLFDAPTMRAKLIEVNAETHSVHNLYPLFLTYAGLQMTSTELGNAVLTIRANYLVQTGRLPATSRWFRLYTERFIRAMTGDAAIIDGALALLRAGNFID